MRVKYLFLILVVFVFSVLKSQEPIYSFFSAGHTYGSPLDHHYHLHYPFVDYIPEINSYSNMEYGFLTGDVVVAPTVEYWDSAQITIATLNMPIYIAAGNHDMGEEFLDRFGSYYSSFVSHDDLFIILTPGLNAWNIVGAQLDFLTNTLDDNYSQVNNVFIMMHELIWWSPDNEYSSVDINYEPHYPGSTNFEDVIKPLLLSYPNNITIYAGDVGCTNQVSPFMYDSFDNITLIASGMGGGVRDNIIITDVYEDSVHYNLIAINGDDPNALGELTDFSLQSTSQISQNISVQVFPNPAKDDINFVINNNDVFTKIEVFNSTGKVLILKEPNSDRVVLNISKLGRGVYFYRISTRNIVETGRIIKE